MLDRLQWPDCKLFCFCYDTITGAWFKYRVLAAIFIPSGR